MTDNKALTRFFQAKHIPPSLWNFCDQTLQFKFLLTHIPGVENPAADYLSRLEIRPEERVHLKLHYSIPVHHIEIDIASKTPKQEEDEPDLFPPGDNHRNKQSKNEKTTEKLTRETITTTDRKQINKILLVPDDEKRMDSPIPPTHNDLPQLDEIFHPKDITYIKIIQKTSPHSIPMNAMSPTHEVDLVALQAKNTDIQQMIRIIQGL